MVDFILQCYKDYIVFMDLEPNILPQLNPIEKSYDEDDYGRNPYAYINSDEINNNPRNLYYNSNLLQKRKDFIKAILFHEYTHLLDEISISKKYSEKQHLSIMSTYSEYHASQIELACKVGFRNIHSFRKINLSKTFVPYEDRKYKIEEDYIYPMADSSLIIDRQKDYYYNLPCEEYFKYYKVFESKTMYYLGKRNFCEKYSFSKIPNITQQTYGEFYPYIHNIEQCIINKDFDKLIEYKNCLWNKFISTFTLKEEELQILLKSHSFSFN